MIRAVEHEEHRRQYLLAVQACPGLAPRMASQLELFWQKPGSGWRFFAQEGDAPAALMVRGNWALGCGRFDPEELGLLLGFLGVTDYTAPEADPPEGYTKGEELPLFAWEGPAPAPGPVPEGVAFTLEPSPWAVSRLVLEETPDPTGEVTENYYSDLCTALNHGFAKISGLEKGGRLICTEGVYGLWEGKAYLAGRETVPEERRKGLGSWLLLELVRLLTEEGIQPWFWCGLPLQAHYSRLGFIQKGILCNFIPKE